MLTSICRSIVTICSGLYLFIGMAAFPPSGFSLIPLGTKSAGHVRVAMLGFSIMRLCRVVAGGVFLATTLAAYAQIKGPKQFDNRVEGTKQVPTTSAQFTPIALT